MLESAREKKYICSRFIAKAVVVLHQNDRVFHRQTPSAIFAPTNTAKKQQEEGGDGEGAGAGAGAGAE